MGTGLRPYRGNWSNRRFTTTSTATFRQWAPVSLSSAGLLQECAGGYANQKLLGIALHASADSFPAGEVLVAIPGFGATALSKIQTGVATSATSIGLAYDIEKSGNNFRIDPDTSASTSSAMVYIVGAVNSADSTVEIGFTDNCLILPLLQRFGAF